MLGKIAIAIDGPAAAGKSTVAKLVAHRLSYIYIDTGAMYRALTLKALQNHIPVNEEEALYQALLHTKIDLQHDVDGQYVFLDEINVTEDIRSQNISNNVSHVSKHARVRYEMVKRQQTLANERGVVMDGRDIGTYVLPNAQVKIFLVASVSERARRRHEENIQKGHSSNIEELKQEIEQRDLIDSKREASPLLKANDAYEVDTTSLSIDQVAECILRKVNDVLQARQ